MVARWLEELITTVVRVGLVLSVVGHVVGKIVVLRSVLLDQLHVLQLDRMVILEGHFIVDLRY